MLIFQFGPSFSTEVSVPAVPWKRFCYLGSGSYLSIPGFWYKVFMGLFAFLSKFWYQNTEVAVLSVFSVLDQHYFIGYYIPMPMFDMVGKFQLSSKFTGMCVVNRSNFTTDHVIWYSTIRLLIGYVFRSMSSELVPNHSDLSDSWFESLESHHSQWFGDLRAFCALTCTM